MLKRQLTEENLLHRAEEEENEAKRSRVDGPGHEMALVEVPSEQAQQLIIAENQKV